MRLTKKAIEAIDKPAIRLRLGLALGFTENWIIQLIARNKENGPLTLAAATEVIRENTGLTDEEILEKAANPLARNVA